MDPTIPDSALLQLMWLASPALPVGGFSYSEGLEAAVDAGLVRDAEGAALWLREQLQLTLARADLCVVAGALTAWRSDDIARVRALDDWVRATRETSELRLQAEQMGRSLVQWLKGLRPDDAQRAASFEPTWPVAFALAASTTTASAREVLSAYAFAWAENMTQAAIKAIPLGQAAGQRILSQLVAHIPAAISHALSQDDAQRQSFSPMLAILSARHETQYSRLFRS